MKKLKTGNLEIKKSKFISILYEINDLNDIELILNEIKKEHKKARHIVYAYKINNLEKKFQFQNYKRNNRTLSE